MAGGRYIDCGLAHRIIPLDEQPFYSMRSKMVDAFFCHHFFGQPNDCAKAIASPYYIIITSEGPPDHHVARSDITSPTLWNLIKRPSPASMGRSAHVNNRTFDIFSIYRRMFVGSRTWSYDPVEENSTCRLSAQTRLVTIVDSAES